MARVASSFSFIYARKPSPSSVAMKTDELPVPFGVLDRSLTCKVI